MQIGHWKQLRVHLPGINIAVDILEGVGVGVPTPLALHSTAWHLKQAIRAIPRHDLVEHTPRTSYLVAVFAVEQVFEGI